MTKSGNISSAYEQLLDMEEYQKEEQANDVGQQEEYVANRWSSERRAPSSLGLSRVVTEEDEVKSAFHR